MGLDDITGFCSYIITINFAVMKRVFIIFYVLLLNMLPMYAQFNTIGRVSKSSTVMEKNPKVECVAEAGSNEKTDSLLEAEEKVNDYMCIAFPLKEVHVGSGFGMRKHPITHKICMHNGIDLRAKYENVYSMLPGKVSRVGEDARSGKYVTIQTACYSISYCHLCKQYVSTGEYVAAGQLIAQSGNTGWSTGPHLHLTTKKDGQAFNPTILLDFVKSVKEMKPHTDS